MTPLKSAWHHIRRSPFQSLISIFITTTTFFTISIFTIVSFGLSNVLVYFETKPEITIFLKDGLEKTTIDSLQKELAGYPEIKEIKYISKEKALSIYQQQNKDNPLLTEMVTSSILPASFEVSVNNVKILEQISQNFSVKKDQVDEIIYQKDIIENLLTWTSFIRKIGVILAIFLTIFSFFLIVIIIGMKINNRKEEISIFRSLGASSFYVKKPFLFEGTFYGLLGSFLGYLITIFTVIIYHQQINTFFEPVVFFPSTISLYFYLALSIIFTGALLGFSASYFGVKRYIKF